MKSRGLGLIFLTAVVSGVSIYANKFAVGGFTPNVFVFLKNSVAAVFLLSAILLLGEARRLRALSRTQWSKLMAIGFLGGSIPFLLFFNGLALTTAASAAFIHKLLFIFVTVLAVKFLGEKVSRRRVAAVTLLVAGNALLLKFIPHSLNRGDLLILAATLLWAFENTLSKHALAELSSRTVAFGRMFFGSAIILGYIALTGQAVGVLALSGAQVGWLLVTSAFLIIYVSSWYEGLKHVDASVAASILLLGSPITTIISIAFAGAALTLTKAAGMLLIVLGVALTVGLADAAAAAYSRLHDIARSRARAGG